MTYHMRTSWKMKEPKGFSFAIFFLFLTQTLAVSNSSLAAEPYSGRTMLLQPEQPFNPNASTQNQKSSQTSTAKQSDSPLSTASYTTIKPTSTLTAKDATALPRYTIPVGGSDVVLPQITRVAPAGASASVTSTSSNLEILQYNTGTGGWAGGGLSYDEFSTKSIEAVDLSGFSKLIVGLKGNPSQVKFEIVDRQGKKASVYLAGIRSTGEQFWAIDTSLFSGVDLTQVQLLYFIVEGARQQGKLEIRFNFNQIQLATISPSTILTPENITSLPGNPQVAQVGPAGDPSKITATSRGVHLDYYTQYGWTGAGLTFDNFSTPGIESADLRGYSDLAFGLQGNTDRVKVEFIDTLGNKIALRLVGITSSKEQVWKISTKTLASLGLDLSKVRLIYFIVEGPGIKGGLDINWVPLQDVNPPVPPPPALVPIEPNPELGQPFTTTCSGALNISTSAATRTCLGTVTTPEGAKEIYYTNQRGNTYVGVYNPKTKVFNDYYVAGLYFTNSNDPRPEINFTPDGKYMIVSHNINVLTTISLNDTRSEPQREYLPTPSGVQKLVFYSNTSGLITTKNGKKYKFVIDQSGMLILTPVA